MIGVKDTIRSPTILLRAPTGLYDRLLPNVPEDDETVTYTCSTPLSPRPELFYPQMPDALLLGVYPVEKFSDRFKRMNNLVSSSTGGGATIPAMSQPLYAPGDIISFQDASTQVVVQEQSDLVIRHDLYVPDLSDLGVSSEDIDEVKQIYTDQISEFAALKSTISDIEVNIDTVQRRINEVNKVLSTINVAIAIKPSASLIERKEALMVRLGEYQAGLTDYLAQLAETNSKINVVSTNIRDLSALVS